MQLIAFSENNVFLTEAHLGFMTNKSTKFAGQSVLRQFHSALDNKKHVIGGF